MAEELTINEAGKDIIKFYESLRLKTYLDTGKVPTIGWGHCGPEVKMGMVISKEKAIEIFDKDISKFQEGVKKLIKSKATTTQNQFSAMVSLAFNIGLGQFSTSSVLRFHNQGQYDKAANSFVLFIKDNGKVLNGLVKRRKSESLLYKEV
jgi:lysozyme